MCSTNKNIKIKGQGHGDESRGVTHINVLYTYTKEKNTLNTTHPASAATSSFLGSMES